MKFNYPKTVLVGSTPFKIKYNYKIDGARFEFVYEGSQGSVTFGMVNHKVNSLQFLDFIIHEFKEIIQVEQGARVHNRADDAYHFHYNHREHSDLCSRLAGIISQFVK